MHVQDRSHRDIKPSINFRNIKSVKLQGLYKEFPHYGKELATSFKENTVALEFCKKYDVDIVFNAVKKGKSFIENMIEISFINPAKSKFLGIFGNQKDQITATGYSIKFYTNDCIKECTERLIENIKEPKDILAKKIKTKEDNIKSVLEKKNLQTQETIKINPEETINENDVWIAFENSLNDLINNHKINGQG
ncbi:hypothetical protein J6R97_02210 [bacterium]|nr:hypothetical protein [bacterium]